MLSLCYYIYMIQVVSVSGDNLSRARFPMISEISNYLFVIREIGGLVIKPSTSRLVMYFLEKKTQNVELGCPLFRRQIFRGKIPLTSFLRIIKFREMNPPEYEIPQKRKSIHRIFVTQFRWNGTRNSIKFRQTPSLIRLKGFCVILTREKL